MSTVALSGLAAKSTPFSQQPRSRGHGRTTLAHLPVREEMVGIDPPQCSACGMAFLDFPGTEDNEVIEIEGHAHRRLIRRKRYRCTCGCGALPGIISADRYRAYQKHSRLHPGVTISYCWAHQRRDALMVANDHPKLENWAMDWVDRIGQLFHLRACRTAATEGRSYAAADKQLRRAVQAMAELRDKTLANRAMPDPASKLMESLKYHWSGLTAFVDHPALPMDNNKAERALRTPVVGRKDFYGSGSTWSASLAATMYSLLLTVRLWGLNEHLWLTDYLTACALNGGKAPAALAPFLPWAMDTQRRAALRANHRPGADSS